MKKDFAGQEIILWDGACGFCRRCVEVSEKWNESGFVFAPHQSFSDDELKKFGLRRRQCERELQVVTRSGRTFGGAFALNYFFWRQARLKPAALFALVFPLIFLMEIFGYRIVAKNRILFSKILFPKKE